MIRFLAPNFLFALGLIAIPVLIHLFNLRRYKRALFTNVRFLQELKEETTRMNRLKHLLVLACRILALTFLVLAFAQPVIPGSQTENKKVKNVVSVFIDNSFSMEGTGKEGTLLDIAIRKAREAAMAYPPSTTFQLLTNGFDAVGQRLISRDEFLEELSRIRIAPVSRMLSEVVRRQSEALSTEPDAAKSLFLISDFQKSTSDINAIKTDTAYTINLVPLDLQASSNLSVDSCWLESPVVQLNRPVTLNARIRNSGDEEAENVPVKLLVNGGQRAVASVAVAAGQTVTVPMNFTVTTSGWQQAEVSISDHPVTFDDRYFLSFEVKKELKVLSIDGATPGPYLKALFGNDPYFSFLSVPASQVDYASLPAMDMVVLNQVREISSGMSDELGRYLQAGGSVVLFPDSDATVAGYNQIAGMPVYGSLNNNPDRVVSADLKHPVFEEVFEKKKAGEGQVDYPVTEKHFVLSKGVKGLIPLMNLQGGDPFLASLSVGKGTMYLFSVPLSPGYSNIARHAMIVPLLYRMALRSINQPAFSYVLGREIPVELKTSSGAEEGKLRLVNKAENVDLIPVHRVLPGGIQVNTGGQLSKSGFYNLNNGDKELAVLAYNYDRRESELNYLSADELTAQAEASRLPHIRSFKATAPSLTTTIQHLNDGTALWKWAIVLALLFLLFETLIIRYWKPS